MNDDDNDLLKYLEGLSTPEGGKKIKVPVDTWVPREMENRGEENSKEIKRLRNSLAAPDPNATPYVAESSSKDLNTLGAYYTDLLNEDEKQGLLFVGDRDFLQDRKAAAQSNFDKASIAVLEFVPGVAGKVIEGFGHVAGGMADVVSMPFTGGKMPGYIFDNSLVDFGKWVGEDFAKIMPQIKSIVAGDSEIHSYSGYSKESKLWNKLAYPEFWTKDFMDGAEFLASALVAGGGAGKVGGFLSTLGKGSKTAKIAEKARAAALAAGADAATASKVAANAVAQTKAGGRWAWGAATLYNTVSEAGVESGEMYKSIKEELDARDPYSKKRKINPDTGLEYTDQDIEDVALQRSYNVFRGNFFGLLLSNGIEMGAFLPAAFKTGRNKLYREVIQESTEKASKIKKSARFGRGLLPGQTAPNTVVAAGKGFATGIVTEALYEENFQNAISRVEGDLSKSYPSGDSMAWVNAFSENLKSFWKGIKGENLNTEEMEAAHSMMLGGILGGGFQTISGVKNHMAEKAKKEGIEKEWQAFQTQLDITDKYLIDNIGSIYKSFEKEVTEKDENGKERKVIKKSYLNDKGETELDYNKVEKLFFQSMYEKNLFDLNKSAIAHNDPYQADYNREFGLGTMVYNYLQSVDKGNDPELAKMILKHRIRESLVETADKKGTFSSEDAQALGISQDAKVLEDLVDAYADIWTNIDESTRVSGEEMDFINKYKKVKFYNEIKKRALNSMLDRANNEENKKAIAELETLIEQEDAYYEKLLEDKDKFKEIYTSQDQAVSNMEDERDDIISKIAQENDLDKKKILVEEKNRLQYFIDEHKKIESSPTQMTEEQRFRADADMKSKDKFLFDLGTSYKAKRAIEEVNIEIHAEKEKLDALRREVSNQEEATEEQTKEIEAIEDQIQRRLQDGFGIVTNNKNHLTKESVAQFQALYDLYVEEESRLVSEIESLNVAFNTSQENQKKFEEAMGEEQKRASFNFYSFFAELSNNVFSFAYDVESPLFEFIMDNFEDPLSLTKEELLDAINKITPTDQAGNIAANDDPQMQRFIEWVNQSFESVGISPAQTYGEVFAGLKGLSDALDEKAVEQHQKAAAEEKEKQKAISLKLDNVDQKHTKFTRGLEKTVTAATDAVRKGVIRDDIRQKAKSSPEVLDRYMKREYAEIPIILVKGQMSLFKADEKSYDAEITPLVNLKNKLLLTKNVYETERKDMEKTKEFKGFMEELNQAIEDIDVLIKAAKANATNIKIKELNKAKKNARVKLAAIGIQVDEFGEWEITNQLIYDQLTEMLEGISNTTGVNLFNSILQDAQGDIIDMGTSAEIVIELATKHKTLTSEEQRKRYLELLKGNVKNAQGLIQRVATETKVLGLFPMDTYIASPERAFRSTLLRKFSNAIFSKPEFTKDNSSFNPIFTFDETRDLDELKAKIQNPLIKDTIGEDLVEETIALIEAHQNLLNAHAAIRYAETSNIFSETHKNETEALLEIANSENIKEKIVPTPEQVVTYREVVKALGLPISGRTAQALSRAFTYVMGPAGSGKSRAVLGWVAKSLGLKKEEMYAFSHETSSSKNIADSTGATQGTLNNFLDPNLDLSKFKLIVIDEIAFFNNKTIHDIEKRVETINRQRATNDKLRVVLLGDPGQTRKESLSSLDQTSVLTNMTVIPPLTVTHRSHVSSINDMQKRFRRTSTEVKDGLTLVSNQDVSLPYNANNEVVGVQGGESRGSIINAIENNKLSGRDKVIVVASEEDKGFYTESSTIQNLMSKGGNNRPHLQVLTYEEVQGQTFPEVYVDIQTSGKNINGQVFSEQDSWLDYNTAMYTALSRASHYAFMIYPGIKNVTSDDIIADKKAGEQRIVDNFSEFARKIEKESEMLSKYIPTYGESSTVEINPNGTTKTKKPKVDPEIVLDPEDDVEIEEDNFDPNDNPTVIVEDDVVEGEIEDEQETSSDVVGSTEDVDMVIDTEDYHDLRYPENSAARGDRGGTQASYPHSTIVPAGTVLTNKDGTEIVVNESSPVIYAKYRDENGVEHVGVFGQIQKNNSFNPGNPQWKLLGIIGPEDETDNFYKANVTPHIDRVNRGGGVATFINGKLDNLASSISYDPQTGKAITNNFSSAQYSPVLYAAEVQYARSLGFKWNLKDNPITNFVSHIMDRVRVGFFGGTMPQRKPSFTVKIFTKTDIKNNDNLKPENRNGHRIRPGVPYFIIENPKGDRTKSAVTDLMFRLTPRKLKQSDFDSDTGGKFAPINKLMEVLSILEKGPNMADKGLGAVDPLTGIAHTNELFKKMARARDENGELGFSENSDGKVIFDRRIYTWEQYQEDIEKDYIELEGAKGHFTEAQFNYIYEVAQELIPLVYGFTTKRKSVVLKSQPEIDAYQKKLDENPKTAGYKLIERENTENSYWVWSNPIGPNEQKTPNYYKEYEKERAFSANKGEAQKLLNELMAGNTQFPLSVEVRVRKPKGGFKVFRTAKNILATASHNGYRGELEQIVIDYIKEEYGEDEVSKHFAMLKSDPLHVLEDRVRGIFNKQDANKTVEEIKAEFKVDPITNESLQNMFGDSAFDNNGEHKGTTLSGHLAMPLDMNEINELGEKLNSTSKKEREDAAAELESIMGTKLESIDGARIIVKKSGIAAILPTVNRVIPNDQQIEDIADDIFKNRITINDLANPNFFSSLNITPEIYDLIVTRVNELVAEHNSKLENEIEELEDNADQSRHPDKIKEIADEMAIWLEANEIRLQLDPELVSSYLETYENGELEDLEEFIEAVKEIQIEDKNSNKNNEGDNNLSSEILLEFTDNEGLNYSISTLGTITVEGEYYESISDYLNTITPEELEDFTDTVVQELEEAKKNNNFKVVSAIESLLNIDLEVTSLEEEQTVEEEIQEEVEIYDQEGKDIEETELEKAEKELEDIEFKLRETENELNWHREAYYASRGTIDENKISDEARKILKEYREEARQNTTDPNPDNTAGNNLGRKFQYWEFWYSDFKQEQKEIEEKIQKLSKVESKDNIALRVKNWFRKNLTIEPAGIESSTVDYKFLKDLLKIFNAQPFLSLSVGYMSSNENAENLDQLIKRLTDLKSDAKVFSNRREMEALAKEELENKYFGPSAIGKSREELNKLKEQHLKEAKEVARLAANISKEIITEIDTKLKELKELKNDLDNNRRTFNANERTLVRGKQVTVKEAQKIAKNLFPGININRGSWIKGKVFSLLGMPQSNEIELKFISKTAMEKLQKPGENLIGIYLDGVVYMMMDEQGTIDENILRHEFFHKIYHEFLTPQERSKLKLAALRDYRNEVSGLGEREFEEWLADNFALFRKRERTFFGRLGNFFANLFRLNFFINKNKNTLENYWQELENRKLRKGKRFFEGKFVRRTFIDVKTNFRNVANFKATIQLIQKTFVELTQADKTNPDKKVYTEGELSDAVREVLSTKLLDIQVQLAAQATALSKKASKPQEERTAKEEESLRATEEVYESLKSKYEVLTLINNKKNFKTVLKYLYPNTIFAKRKVIDVHTKTEQDIETIESDSLSFSELLESINLKDVIDEVETKDNEQSLSLAVKMMLSNLKNWDTGVILNSRYAYAKAIRLMESISGEIIGEGTKDQGTLITRLGEAIRKASGLSKNETDLSKAGDLFPIYMKVLNMYNEIKNPRYAVSSLVRDGSKTKKVYTYLDTTKRLFMADESTVIAITLPESNPNYKSWVDLIRSKNLAELQEMQKRPKWRNAFKVYHRNDSKLKSAYKQKVKPPRGKERVSTEFFLESVAMSLIENHSDIYSQIPHLQRQLRSTFRAQEAANGLREFYSLMSSMREKNLYVAHTSSEDSEVMYMPASSVSNQIEVKETLISALEQYIGELVSSEGMSPSEAIEFIVSKPYSDKMKSGDVDTKVDGLLQFLDELGLSAYATHANKTSLAERAEDMYYFLTEHLTPIGSIKPKPKQDVSKLSEEELIEYNTVERVTLRDLVEKQGSLFTKLARSIATGTSWLRATSVRDAKGNTVYLHHDSSQADDLLVMLGKFDKSKFKGSRGTFRTLRLPPHLKHSFFTKNIFTKGLNKIKNIIDHDGFKNVTTGRNVTYARESKSMWTSRNINAGFFSMINNSSKRNINYAQWVYTISNRPRIKGAIVDFLNPTQIKESINSYLEQVSERPNLVGKIKNFDKFSNTNFSILDDIIKLYHIKEGETFEQARERVMSTELESLKKDLVQQMYDRLTTLSRQYAQELIDERFQFSDNANLALDKLKQTNKLDTSVIDNTQVLNSKYILSGSAVDVIEELQGEEAQGERYEQSLDQVHLAIDMVFKNNYINSFFLTQLVAGDSAYYKNALDQVKRMQGAFAPGKKGLVNKYFGMKEKYRTAVIEDQVEGTSSIVDFLIKIALNKDPKTMSKADKEIAKLKISPILEKFGKDYELTDAQGFILPERAADIGKGFGRSYKAGRVFKGAHFENTVREIKDENGNVLEVVTHPFMVKYSSIELTDDLIYETRTIQTKDGPRRVKVIRYPHLYNLRNKMRNHRDQNGNPTPLDEVVFGSGNKIGQPLSKITAEKAIDTTSIFPHDSVVELSNENFRLQSNPDHVSRNKEKGVANPSQLGYFLSVMQDMVKDDFKANQIVYNKLAEIIARGNGKILNSLGDGKGNIDPAKFGKFVKQQMTGQGNERLYDLLINGVNYNAPHIVNKALSQLTGKVTKQTVGLRFPGDKLTLQSSYGIRTKSNPDNARKISEEILKKGEELEYYINEYGGLEAEVIIPSGLLPKKLERAIAKGEKVTLLPDMLGFRIPSTELHSAVSLRVVGFYDTRGTSIIIAPKELVPLHGSDFDVDSLFVIYRSHILKEDIKIRDRKTKQDIDILGPEFSNKIGTPLGYVQDSKTKKFILNSEEINKITDRFTVLKSVHFDNKSILQKIDRLEDQLAMNIILDAFLSATTHADNVERMVSPITMELFNGKVKNENEKTESGFGKDTIFNLISELQVKQIDNLYQNNKLLDVDGNQVSEEEYKLIREKAKNVQTSVDLSDIRGNYAVFKSNMEGRDLTGVYANAVKSLAYIVQAGLIAKSGNRQDKNQMLEMSLDYHKKISEKLSENIDALTEEKTQLQQKHPKGSSNLHLVSGKLGGLTRSIDNRIAEKAAIDATISQMEEKVKTLKGKKSSKFPFLTQKFNNKNAVFRSINILGKNFNRLVEKVRYPEVERLYDVLHTPGSVVWSMATTGKTDLKNKYSDKFIDFDEVFKKNNKKEEWKALLDENTAESLKQANKILLNTFREAKKQASEEGKVLLASQQGLLDLVPSELDMIVGIKNSNFFKLRILERPDTESKDTEDIEKRYSDNQTKIEQLKKEHKTKFKKKNKTSPYYSPVIQTNEFLSDIYEEKTKGMYMWEVLDSLINSAIDNVKEQILPVINANGLTANTFSALLSLGVPIKTVVLMAKQSTIASLNVSGRKEIELNLMIKNVTEIYSLYMEDQLYKRKDAGERLSLEEIERLEDAEENLNDVLDSIEITDDLLEELFVKGTIDSRYFGQNYDKVLAKMTMDPEIALTVHLKILKEFKKAMKIGEDIATLSTALNILKQLPSDMATFRKIEESWNKMFPKNEKTGEREFNGEFSFYIPDFLNNNPHIKTSLEVFDSTLNILEKGFLKHNKKISEYIRNLWDKTNLRLGKNKYESVEKLKDDFIHFLYTSIPLMRKIDETLTYSKSGKYQVRTGYVAWSQEFVDKIDNFKESLRNNSISNGFLGNVAVRRMAFNEGYLQFTGGSSLQFEDILELQEEFERLNEYEYDKYTGDIVQLSQKELQKRAAAGIKYSEFQQDFVRYALVNFGIQFGATNYSMILPADILSPYVDEMVVELEKIINKNKVSELGNIFEVQAMLNYGKELPGFKATPEKIDSPNFPGATRTSGYDSDTGIFYNLKVKTGEGFKNISNEFIRWGKYIYKNLGKYNNHWFFVKVGKANTRKSYMLNKKLKKQYSPKIAFSPYVLQITDFTFNEAEQSIKIPDNYEIKPNKTVLMLRKSHDTARLQAEPYVVTEQLSEYEKEEKYEGSSATFKIRKLSEEEKEQYGLMPEDPLTLSKKEATVNSDFSDSQMKSFQTVEEQETDKVKDILEEMQKFGSYSGKMIANLLLSKPKLLKGITVEYESAYSEGNKTVFGSWSSENPKKIVVSAFKENGERRSMADIEKTFIHELLHALTMKTLLTPDSELDMKQRQAKRKINRLYEDFLQKLINEGVDIKSYYGLTNVYEFISEAYSNPEFQKLLDSYKLEGNRTKTYLKRLLEFLGSIFGAVNPNSLLAEVMNTSILLFDNPKGFKAQVQMKLYSATDSKKGPLSNEKTIELDPITKGVLANREKWVVPEHIDENGVTTEADFYQFEDDPTLQLPRLSSETKGLLIEFTLLNKKDRNKTFAQRAADKRWKGVNPDVKIPTEGQNMSKQEYKEWLEMLADKGKLKGSIMHAYIELLTHNEFSNKSLEKVKENLGFYINQSDSMNPEKAYGWIEESLPKIFKKLGINALDFKSNGEHKIPLEHRDQIFSEVTIPSTTLGFAGTTDMLVRHSDSTYSLLDWKTTRSFESEIEHSIYKYGDQFGYVFDNAKNKAQLQLALYAFMLKVENPQMKFRDLMAVWIPNKYEAGAYDPNAGVDINNFLAMIEAFYKDQHGEPGGLYEQIKRKSPKAFNKKEYNASDATLHAKMIKENKTPQQLYESEQQKLKELIQSKLDRRDLTPKDRKKITKLTKLLVNFANDNSLPIKDWTEDISWGSRVLGDYANINHPVVEAYRSALDEAKDKSAKAYQEDYRKFQNLLKPVVSEYMKKKGKPGFLSRYVIGDLINPTGVTYKDLYAFAYKEIEIEGAKILRIKTEKDVEWDSLTLAQKKLLRFTNDKFGSFFEGGEQAFLTDTAVNMEVEGSFSTLTNIELYNQNKKDIDKFEYYRGFLPVIPPTNQDIIEKFGGFAPWLNKEYWTHLKHKHLTYYFEYQYEQWGQTEEAIPIRGLGTRHQRMNKNHTMNLAITFDRYMRSMYEKKYGDNVHALGRGMQVALEQSRAKGVKETRLEQWLDEQISMQLINKTEEPFDVSKKPLINVDKDGRVTQIKVDKVLKAFKRTTSGAIMKLMPINGMRNGLSAYLLSTKEAVLSEILSIPGMGKLAGIEGEEHDFNERDLFMGTVEALKSLGSDMTPMGDHMKNKAWLLSQELRFSTTAYDLATRNRYLDTVKKNIFGDDFTYLFYSLPEEVVATAIMVAQLRSMKMKTKGYEGQSVWDQYKVVKDAEGVSRLEWTGPIRGYKKLANGELKELTKVDHHEAAAMRAVYKKIHGGYRQSERTSLDFYIIFSVVNQFKKYLPALLKGTFESKAQSNVLGRYKVTEDNSGQPTYVVDEKTGNQIPVLEWRKRITEGRWTTMIMLARQWMGVNALLNYTGIPEKRGWQSHANGAYKWSNLSYDQKRNFFDGLFTIGAFLAAYAVLFRSYNDEPEDESWRKFWGYVIDTTSQQWNPRDLFKNIKGITEAPSLSRSYKTYNAVVQMGWYAFLNPVFQFQPFTDDKNNPAYTKDGTRKGMNEFMRGVPFLSAYYQWNRFWEGVSDSEDPSRYRR